MECSSELGSEICILTAESVSRVYTVYAMDLRYCLTRIGILVDERPNHMLIPEHSVS